MLKLLNIEPNNYCAEARDIIASVAEISDVNFLRSEVLDIIEAYDVLVTRLSYNLDRELLTKASKLKVIVTATTGLEHVDLDSAKDLNIDVLSLKGQTDFLKTVTATAEHAWGLLLSLIRKQHHAFKDVLDGNWERDRFRGVELKGKVLGIVGFGRLGRMVASYGKAFGMKIYAHDIHDRQDEDVEFVSLEDLLEVSDVVSLHVPFNEETKDMLNHKRFMRMKQGSVLINTSRGEIIEESALLNCLENGMISGAGLDVLAAEYKFRNGNAEWPENDPLVKFAKTHSNLILTPHIGGATVDSMRDTEVFMARQLRDHLKNKGLLD